MTRLLDRFLFAPLDARAAGLLRIAFALALPFLFASTDLELTQFQSYPFMQQLYDDLFLTEAYGWLVVAACVLLGVGWRPRLMVIVLLVLTLPLLYLSRGYISRKVFFMSLVAFSLVRSDAAFSLFGRHGKAGPIWPLRLMQLQLTLLYGVNALAKSSPAYLSGDVLMALSLTRGNFLVDMSDGSASFGPIAIPVVVAGVGSALTEWALTFGFWFRKYVFLTALIGIGFHFVLTHVVAIFQLDYTAVFLYLAFVLPAFFAQE